MDQIVIADVAMNIANRAVNVVSRVRYCFDYFRYKNILRRNEKFRNIGQGKTCYILANGPSLKELDPTLLQGKDVLTVNVSFTTELFDRLKPKYHCILDRGVYAAHQEELKKTVAETPSTTFFFHRKLYEDYGDRDNAYYLYGTLMPVSKRIKSDITKNCNGFINIVAWSTMLALYMGYERIVLLGCDFSFFALRKNKHFYDVGDKEVKSNMFFSLQGAAIMREQLSYLDEYARKRGVKIYNAAPGSLLDVFPRVPLEELL